VRSILGAAIEEEADVTLVDMEAGLEHLSRSGGTLAYADVLLVVMEPSRKSVLTAGRTLALAEELGLHRVYAVGNKARLPEDAEFYAKAARDEGLVLAGVVPHDTDVVAADRAGTMLGAGDAAAARQAVDGIVDFLASDESERAALLRAREQLEQRLAELEQESSV